MWLSCGIAGRLLAEGDPTPSEDSKRLTDIELRNLIELKPETFMPDTDGTRLYSGKKAMAIDPAADPVIANNNFRLELRRITGAMLLEEEIQGTHFNVGFRGMPPNNAVFTQVYQDGFPLNIDTFGRRIVVAVPDPSQTAQMQFVGSGSGILFGPQPGGSVNFISYPIAGDRALRARNTATGGSYGFFSDLFEASGTVDDFSYGGFLRASRGDGFPDNPPVQPGFNSTSGGLRLVKRLGDSDAISLGYQAYSFKSDQLSSTLRGAANNVQFNNLFNYYFQEATQHRLDLLYQHEFTSATRAESRAWFHYTRGFTDFSGVNPFTLGPVTEHYYNWGTDTRVAHEYELGNTSGNLLTAGFTVQGTLSPMKSDAAPGTFQQAIDLDRHDLNWAVYAENKFQILDRWSVTPGIRFEYAEIAGRGTLAGGSIDRRFEDYAPLFSLGTEVDVIEPSGINRRPLVLYANVANAYRPPTYSEFVMQFPGVQTAGLENSELYQVEAGLRGTPIPWYLYDVSVFGMRYEKQFAGFNDVENSGRTLHYGVEWFQEVNLFGLIDALTQVSPSAQPRTGPRSSATETGLARYGRLSVFSAITYLNTEIETSPASNFEGLRVPYAPERTFKVGLEYNYFERIKAAVSFLSISDYFGNANNDNGLVMSGRTGAFIPGYSVVDLSLEYSCWKDRLTFFVNLNNVFDKHYFAGEQGQPSLPPFPDPSQITAPGRNVYGGLRLSF
ncbi:MAG TPA: TonB-dependent receptor [Candidatus Binatia bacterium]|nr:TonB-dependent receptor [Candidatus Binatia bacterium]